MNREPNQPLEDADIAKLVHEVVDGWSMPPVRLDAPTWRERVRSPRARQADWARGWLTRLGRAATAAVALTVAATLIAVVITFPSEPGKSPGSSDGSSPRATDAAVSSPLPKIFVPGDLPSPSRVVVQTENGDFAIVDLKEGSISRPITGSRFGSALQVRVDGRLFCLCLSESDIVDDNPTTATVTLEKFEADGTPIASAEPVLIRSFTGAPDPRDEGQFIPDRPPHVLTSMAFSDFGAFGFVGWSTRADPVWRGGLLVVDLETGAVVSEIALPDVTAGDDDSRRVVDAPRVVGQAGSEGLVIGRSWYELTPPTGDAVYTYDTEAFRVSLTGGVLGDPVAVPGMAGCGDTVRFGGPLADGGTWVACTRGGAFQTVVRRVKGDGEPLPDVLVSGEEGIQGDATAMSRDGRLLFAWNPASATLTKVDVATGVTTTGTGPVARGDSGPLSALGRWLAPVAAAKTFLQSSVIVSRDGARVYAIGVREGLESADVHGSTGVFAFEAATLDLIAVFEPTAAFVSLGIAADGRYVYAAGLPGVDAFGRSTQGQDASITAFDTADGATRLIAGQLGVGRITFGPELLR